MSRFSYRKPVYNKVEDYDPALQRLNTLDKLEAYCDSIYRQNNQGQLTIRDDGTYPEIASAVVRNRFYHGYSVYGFSNNFMAMLFSQISIEGLSAIVLPDDILKYPFAACSQQSIVMMDLLRRKGFAIRKVGFKGKKYGHFCFEANYQGTWHFYDPNMEPDVKTLNAYNRPGIAFLAGHRDILLKAYHRYPEELVLDVFPNYFYGRPNEAAAPRARLFQQVTKFLSYTMWTFFLLAFIWTRRLYKRMAIQAGPARKRKTVPVELNIAPSLISGYSA